MKKTKRKGFNFFRSYYDVYNMIDKDSDKIAFIEALLDKQFLGKNPVGLKGLVNFAWVSQVNSIDSQVKGWEDKTGLKLTPTEGGAERGGITPTEQVEGKGEVKEKEQVVSEKQVLEVFKQARTKKGLQFNVKKLTHMERANLNLLNDYTLQDFELAIKNALDNKWVINNSQGFPAHVLKPEQFTKYLNTEVKKALTIGQLMNGAE
jgi:hypothetical protein